MSVTEFYVSSKHQEDLGGRLVAPKTVVTLTDEEKQRPEVQALIDRGVLVPPSKSKKKRSGDS